MKITTYLPVFLECMQRWEKPPTLRDFDDSYFKPISKTLGQVFDHDPEGLFSAIEDLNWSRYRKEVLKLNPARELERVRYNIEKVQELFGFELAGEVVLFSALECMDGYARFDRVTHQVVLGVDESHGRGAYLDVLETHELTHVARESRPQVWEGFGLNPKMTHDEFTENQRVIEHLVGEGFSCVVSEILVPGEFPWNYAYQTQDSLEQVMLIGPALDRGIHEELRKSHAESDYSRLYSGSHYRVHGARIPSFAHYVWAWQWVKQALQDFAGGDPAKFVTICSKEMVEHALQFKLKEIL